MSTLKAHEKKVFERIFDRGGYVLDFNDRTYAEFFREHRIDINHSKYYSNGSSKMKRLRSFWEQESDEVVGRVIKALLQYAKVEGNLSNKDENTAQEVINRLLKMEKPKEVSEESFLDQDFSNLALDKLSSDQFFIDVIHERISEIQRTLSAKAFLSTIFLCGSTLEGLLNESASKNYKEFNQAKSAPKDKNGDVLKLDSWKLSALIDVAYDLKIISLDVKKYSHALREFRNFIHPRQQILLQCKPDRHTAEISYKVLQAAIADLTGQR